MSANLQHLFSLEKQLNLERFDIGKGIWLPYIERGCFGTFRGLFSDVVVERINLTELISPNSETHAIKVGGDSLIDENIISGDRVILDESKQYETGKKVAVWINEYQGWTVKTLDITKSGYYLISATGDFNYKLKSYDKPLGVVKKILMQEYNSTHKTLRPSFFPEAEKKTIDIEKLLRPRASSTFCAKVGGDSLYDARVKNNDIVIVDKSLEYINGKKIVFWLHEYQGYTIKILSIRPDGNYLVATNSTDFLEYKIKEYDIPWGMVTWTIHKP